jgi:hypothetical protein
MFFPLVFLDFPFDQLSAYQYSRNVSIITFCRKSRDQVAPGAKLETVAIVVYGSLKSRVSILAKEEWVARWAVILLDCRLHSSNIK